MEIFGELQNSQVFAWVILPLLIFLARITDQTIGTLRLIFLSKGFRLLAPILGFFEVIIWLLAVSQIMKHLDNFMCYVAYGAGFAMGNYLGIRLDQALSIGKVMIRVILRRDNHELFEEFNARDIGYTLVDAEGARGRVKIVFSIINRRDVGKFINLLDECEPDAFYTIEDVKSTKEGIFPDQNRRGIFNSISYLLMKTK